METNVTLSFVPSRYEGNRNHNNRTLATGGIRKCGDPERRDWNQYILDNDPREVLKRNVMPYIEKYNNKMLEQNRPGRCVTFDSWLDKQLTNKNGKGRPKNMTQELIFQISDNIGGCPYIYKTDPETGKPIATDGSIIERWQRNKKLQPVRDADGKLKPSIRLKRHRQFLYKLIIKFHKDNPDFVITGIYLHADEHAGIHAHVQGLMMTKKRKNSIGISLAYNTYCKEWCNTNGVKYGNTKADNPEKAWQAETRKRLIDECNSMGLTIIDGGCKGRKHESIPQYKRNQDVRIAEIDSEVEEKRKLATEAIARQKAEAEADLKKKADKIAEAERSVKKRSEALAKKEAMADFNISQRHADLERMFSLQQVDLRNEKYTAEKKAEAADKRTAEADARIRYVESILNAVKQNCPPSIIEKIVQQVTKSATMTPPRKVEKPQPKRKSHFEKTEDGMYERWDPLAHGRQMPRDTDDSST